MLFIRTFAVLQEDSVYKRIFVNRYLEYFENEDICVVNTRKSPTFDILRVSGIFGLLNEVGEMLLGTRVYSKKQWKDLV